MTVYFVQEDVPGGLVKIGYTGVNPHGRIFLQTGNGRPLKLLAAAPGEQAGMALRPVPEST